jgi:opacity protein-like surface antigen
MTMKSLIKAVAIAAVLAVPAVSFAQSNQPVTRAQVRAELVQLEKAGYNPSDSSDAHYPDAVQRAEARVTADTTGYGPATAGTAQSGVRRPVYNQFLGSPYDHS